MVTMITHSDDGKVARLAAVCPELTIGACGNGPLLPHLDAEDLGRQASAELWHQGFFSLPASLSPQATRPLRRGITKLVEQDLHPALIFAFDQAWQLAAAVRPLAEHFLGPDCVMLPHLWAWYIDGRTSASGWPAHRDLSGASVICSGGLEMPISLSLWIALSDTDETNGCMSVLPLDAAGRELPEDQAIALPVSEGSVLGWRQDVLHWGGKATASSCRPRVSLALEFQAGWLEPPLASPLLDPDTPPAVRERIDLITAQAEKYQSMAKHAGDGLISSLRPNHPLLS